MWQLLWCWWLQTISQEQKQSCFTAVLIQHRIFLRRRVKTSFLGKQEDKTCVPGLCVTGCHWPELGTMKCVSEEIPQRDHRAAGNWVTAQNGHWAANLSAAAALHSPLERFPGFCISSIPRACPYCPLCIPGSDPGLCYPKWVGTISRRWLHVNNNDKRNQWTAITADKLKWLQNKRTALKNHQLQMRSRKSATILNRKVWNSASSLSLKPQQSAKLSTYLLPHLV